MALHEFRSSCSRVLILQFCGLSILIIKAISCSSSDSQGEPLLVCGLSNRSASRDPLGISRGRRHSQLRTVPLDRRRLGTPLFHALQPSEYFSSRRKTPGRNCIQWSIFSSSKLHSIVSRKPDPAQTLFSRSDYETVLESTYTDTYPSLRYEVHND
jgi:hypothetical protein